LWSDGAAPLLIVCEEAHRYAALDRAIGFGPTRRAISRIAKEGRKCGVFLALATQRPAELDPTIISQCSTLFAMRMSNDRDQSLLRSAVSDAAANLFGFVPSLGTREALAFGVGVPLPTRLTFAELPPQLVPKCDAFADQQAVPAASHDLSFIAAVLGRWRGAMARSPANPDDGSKFAIRPDAVPLQPSAPDAARLNLLKKPLGSPATPPTR
jgi:DNA helicase HerA-like ATPase